jgi:predicted membrane-bound spermidine synthase
VTDPGRRFRAVCLLFLVSGAVGLVYEVVWMRMATRVFGCTTYATSVVLAAFMAGLALGSWAFGSHADRGRSPLVIYAWLEIGSAACALVVPALLPALLPVYRLLHPPAGDPGSRIATEAVLVFLVLLAPTALMGGTLPVLSTLAARSARSLGAPIATLYGWNTFGAVAGGLASGLVLLGTIGERGTVLAGVALQVAVGLAAFRLVREPEFASASTTPGEAFSGIPGEASGEAPDTAKRARLTVFWAFAASGFTSLACEVVWTRVLPSLLLTSVYAFSGMLALFLAGIGAGSLAGRRLAIRATDPVGVLAGLQMLLALLSLLGYRAIDPLRSALAGAAHPRWDPDFYFTFPLRLLAAAVVIVPPALLLGAAFPLVMRSCVREGKSAARTVGRLYAMNTLGCIAGSLAAGFLLIPFLGSAASMIVLALINATVALALFFSCPGRIRRPALAAGLVLPLVVLVPAAIGIEDPYRRVALEGSDPRAIVLFQGEDVAATTVATGVPGVPPSYRLQVNGEGMTVVLTEIKLMAYLPLVITPEPRRMLILCFGMGTTFRSAMIRGGLDVTTVELVPDVYRASGHFNADVPRLLASRDVRAIVDDARNHLALSDARYDVITMDPPPPVDGAGVVNFYTKEFHALCRKHLNPGGVVCLWVPPSPGSEVMMILRTFAESYTDVSVWRGPSFPGFYLIGSQEPQRPNPDRLQALFARPGVREDLAELDDRADTPEKVASLYLSDRQDLLRFTEGTPVITDDLPLTEFPLWRRLFNPGSRADLNAAEYAEWLHANGNPDAAAGGR